MTVSELLKKIQNLPADADVFVADDSITGWPMQVPIEQLLFNEKRRELYLLLADTQSLPPDEVIDQITYGNK